MDEVSKRCLFEFFVSIILRTLLSVGLFFIPSLNNDFSIFRHLSILIAVWIITDTLFIFLPNFIRHQRRWRLSEEYRIEVCRAVKQNGGLKTIYSKLLDNYPIKPVSSD